MSGEKKSGSEPHLPERGEEAQNLAREGIEEIEHGDKEEGAFLIDEARELDRKSADQVLKSARGKG